MKLPIVGMVKWYFVAGGVALAYLAFRKPKQTIYTKVGFGSTEPVNALRAGSNLSVLVNR